VEKGGGRKEREVLFLRVGGKPHRGLPLLSSRVGLFARKIVIGGQTEEREEEEGEEGGKKGKNRAAAPNACPRCLLLFSSSLTEAFAYFVRQWRRRGGEGKKKGKKRERFQCLSMRHFQIRVSRFLPPPSWSDEGRKKGGEGEGGGEEKGLSHKVYLTRC